MWASRNPEIIFHRFQTIAMTYEEKIRIAQILVERMHESIQVDRRANDFPEWKPDLGKCHENVDRWVLTHDGCTAIRGWLDISNEAIPPNRRFAAHSVVFDGTELFDITLGNNKPRHQFVRHPGTDDDFMRFANSKTDHTVECTPK